MLNTNLAIINPDKGTYSGNIDNLHGADNQGCYFLGSASTGTKPSSDVTYYFLRVEQYGERTMQTAYSYPSRKLVWKRFYEYDGTWQSWVVDTRITNTPIASGQTKNFTLLDSTQYLLVVTSGQADANIYPVFITTYSGKIYWYLPRGSSMSGVSLARAGLTLGVTTSASCAVSLTML